MFIKILVHQKKKWFFLMLFLFLAIPLWLFEAPEASAYPTSEGLQVACLTFSMPCFIQPYDPSAKAPYYPTSC